jgi:hypothetical protein
MAIRVSANTGYLFIASSSARNLVMDEHADVAPPSVVPMTWAVNDWFESDG